MEPGHEFGQTRFRSLSGQYAPRLPDYGQKRSIGANTCGSEPSGMTCTDASTGHFFRMSSESYDLG